MSPRISTVEFFSKLKQNGFRWLVAKLFRHFIYRRQNFILLDYQLATKLKNYKTSSRWSIRKFTDEDLDALDAYLAKYKKDYRELLDMGCTAYGAFETATGHAIAIICFTDKDFYDHHYLHNHFPVGPNQIYQFAGEVAQKYRNTAVSILVFKKAWKDWHDLGKTEVYCAVDLKNIASIKYHVHLRFREMGQQLTRHRLLGWEWSSIAPYTGEKLAPYHR